MDSILILNGFGTLSSIHMLTTPKDPNRSIPMCTLELIAGGWWSLPTNWKRNTAILGLVSAGLTIMIWRYTAQRERRHHPPTRKIPSMMVTTQCAKD